MGANLEDLAVSRKRPGWLGCWAVLVGLLGGAVASAQIAVTTVEELYAVLDKHGDPAKDRKYLTIDIAAQLKPTAPLDLRGMRDVVIRWPHAYPAIIGVGLGPRQPVVDISGSQDCRFEGLHIYHTGGDPACGLLLSRTSGNSAPGHHFDRVRISGRYRFANVVNYGGEVITWTHPILVNGYPGGGNYWSSGVIRDIPVDGLGPMFAAGGTGAATFVGGTFGVYARTGREWNVWLGQQVNSVSFQGTHFSNRTDTRTRWDRGGLAAFIFDGVRDVALDGCKVECNGARYGVVVRADCVLNMRGGELSALENPLHIENVLATLVFNGMPLRGANAAYSRALAVEAGAGGPE